MNDFLFSFQNNNTGKLTAALKLFRTDPELIHQEWSGTWGNLVTVGPAYPGFSPVETEEHLIIVLGGPLPRYDHSIATGKYPDDGTKWILERWKNKNQIVWDDDLVGHFLIVCVAKQSGKLTIVTDINSFVPAYITDVQDNVPLVIGSHADAVAVTAGVERNVDPVSVADFLMNETVTFPYTMYKEVEQLPPTSEITIDANRNTDVSTYWIAEEKEREYSFKEAAKQIRETIVANTERMCASQDKVGLLMSGGEDSRVVLSAIPKETQVYGVTFVDSFNREASLAKNVAQRFDVQWKCRERSSTHYIDHAVNSVKLSESHNSFSHAHLSGLSNSIHVMSRCLGAHLADTLIKAFYLPKRSKFGITYQIVKSPKKRNYKEFLYSLNPVLTKELDKRREKRYSTIKATQSIRSEFAVVRPASMTPAFSHSKVKRRLCFSYEPFMDAKIFKIAMSIPAEWKVNRKLYHKAMKPLLQSTWNVQHTKGFYPYFGLWVNTPLIIVKSTYRKVNSIAKKIGIIQNEKNEGSWPKWDKVISSEEFKQLMESSKSSAQAFLESENIEHLEWAMSYIKNAKPAQQIVHLHVLIWLSILKANCAISKDIE